MRDLSELNINEGGKPVQRSAPSKDVVEAFQTNFGVKLPDDYIRLLNYSNGGHPQLDSIEPIGKSGATRWAVNRFYHLNEDKKSGTGLWTAMERWRPILGNESLPFGADGGGNQFFLDLTTSPAAVKVCICDQNFELIDISPSFEAFVDALSIDPDMV